MTFSKLGTDTDTGEFVYLPKASRIKGVYILGLQGSGKSGLIENLCVEDGKQGTGFCVIDPHGELIDNVISRLPANRVQDVILFNIRDYHYPFGLNIFYCSDPTNPLVVQEVVDQVMHVFELLVGVSQETRLILQYLRKCTSTLIANPGYTMADILLLLTDSDFRQKLVGNVTDPNDLLFWKQYNTLKPDVQEERSGSIQRRVEDFLQPLTFNIVGQSKTSIDFRFVMDEGKILLVKLDSLRLPNITNLIGALIVSLFLNSAPARTKKNLFNIYADEFPLYATEDFVTLIEQARKRQIGLAMAHQNRGQLDARTSNVASKLRDRTLGTKQKIIFTITGQDGDEVAGEFDVSPQAAWEEEIEKEWVEVLKAEWFERREEEVIDGEEEIKTPVKDVVHHLLNGGTPPHPVIRNFVMGTLSTKLGRYPIEFDDFNHPLNKLFYEAMAYQRFDTPLSKETWQYLTEIHISSWPLFFEFSDLRYDKDRKWVYRGGFSYERDLNDYTPWDLDTIVQGLNVIWTQPHNSPICQQWITYLDTVLTTFRFEEAKDKNKGQKNTYNYTSTQLEQSYWQNARHGLDLARTAFLNFLQELKAVTRAFATPEGRIEVGSGVLRPRKRKQINILTHPRETITHPRKVIMHPQRTYQDVKNDIANQLSGLSNFTARVRLDETLAQNPGKKCLSCKLLNNLGAKYCRKCGTKLPTPNEYTIETIKPTGYIGTQQLKQRMQGIQTNNIRDGYVKNREDVEKEIAQRQTVSSGGSAPAQPQQPQQHQARHARQVPVQGHCPTCNATNPRGSKFCNNCGTKLP